MRRRTLLAAGAGASALALSACGILTPVTGALWHNVGSLLVVMNAALLLTVGEQEKCEKNVAIPAPVC